MEWQVVKVKSRSGKNVAFVSIGRGQLDFNARACELINDDGKYKYAQLLKGKENGKIVVGVKFLTEHEEDSIPVSRKLHKGKLVAGMTIRNKGTITELFGKEGASDRMVRHGVECIGESMLKILD